MNLTKQTLTEVYDEIKKARNILHAHNRPSPLPNRMRLKCRDRLDKAIGLLFEALEG